MSSKDSSLTCTRPTLRGSRNQQSQSVESNENVFDNSSSSNAAQFPPPRSPLHAIADPTQMRRDLAGESSVPRQVDGNEDKSGGSGLNHPPSVGKWGTVSGSVTPKISSGRGKGQAQPQPESNSGQSTPASRSAAVKSLTLAGGSSNKGCQLSISGRLGGLSSRVSRRFTILSTNQAGPAMVDVPHFELEEDPSFWKDHNVQVLIRIRPLNNMERVMQGYDRCLKQESPHTLVWLGHPETRFTFDHIAGETITQEELFRVAGLPMVDNCMSGYNSCIFAYGQTGSGKTYTMMGEIQELESRLHEDCGITPRIFEYLFSRIKVEEESRRDAKLTFSCKCSFLEIYNEQITDLLEPTSTNLQLREDLKKGVYVENLTEHNVRTVKDVLQLLVQGAANRKIAATHMNSESSRSHSVFTCIIESRWEKDSMTHFRYGRLNLVDLAGSERQKSSGAEGGRLKEAANINRSLSTLGLVIMSLVDVAHGKSRHVPYRDSRLTFLLQDSLGGNSKTSVIANISPSLCSATETLSTLKFAQRAKLIQNNAKVNEDASGDVVVLQHHIQRLKDQLSNLMNQGFPEVHPLTLVQSNGQLNPGDIPSNCDPLEDKDSRELSTAKSKIKFLETALARSLEREKAAQSAVVRLEAEIEQMNHMVGSRSTSSDIENETASGKMAMDRIIQSNEDSRSVDKVSLLPSEVEKELSEARLLIEALESELLRLSQELLLMNQRNQQLMDKLGKENIVENPALSSWKISLEGDVYNNLADNFSVGGYEGSIDATLKLKFDRVTKDLEEAKLMNIRYQENQVLQVHHEKDADLVREQVEVETANTIIHLQEELNSLQVELNERLCSVTAENNALRNVIAYKDDEMRQLSSQWERAAFELTSFLLDGSRSLNQASVRVKTITGLFPQDSFNLGEQVERAAKVCMDKEETILMLQKSLEDAQKMAMEMREKFISLRGATIALTEAENPERNGRNDSSEPRETTFDEKIIRVECSRDIGIQIQQAHEDVEVLNKRSADTFQGVLSSDEYQMKSLVHVGVLELNSRLALIQASMGRILKQHGCPISSEDLIRSDEWDTDSSSSESSLSVSSAASVGNTDCHGLHLSNNQEPTENKILHKTSNEDNATLSFLAGELHKGFETFRKVFATITALVGKNVPVRGFPYGGAAGSKHLTAVPLVGDHDANNQCEHGKNGALGTSQLFQSSGQCAYSPGLVPDDGQDDRVIGFMTKFEEAYTTIKEADLMLNALVEANESAMHVTNSWKSEGLNLKGERDCLVDQVQKLESLLSSQEIGNEALEIGRQTLIEIRESVFALGDFFMNMESDSQGWFKGIYTDLLSVSKDVKEIVHLLRLLLDSICSDLMEKDFTFSVLVECLSDSLRRTLALNSHTSVLLMGEVDPSSPQHCAGSTRVSGLYGIGNKGAPEAGIVHKIGKPLEALSSLIHENSILNKELDRKEVILKGLLFDFSLVQEAASNSKDIKDEINKLIVALGQSERELQDKKCELDDLQIRYKDAKDSHSETINALSVTNEELVQAKTSLDTLSNQNTKLSLHLEDLNHRYSEAEKQLEEQSEVIKGLENEILHLTTSTGERSLHSSGELEDDIAIITEERDQLREEISSLKKKIELAYALAEENEALATEARQDSEANKVYAEQKEEEVKILEISIEELERTVDVLEKKVHEMDEEVQKHRFDRSSLEMEVQALRMRLSTVENFTENLDLEDLSQERIEKRIPRQVPKQWLDFQEANRKIEGLEKIKTEQAKEIERMKNYISELVLHAEAQASQYQQKFKTLESMVKDVKANPSSSFAAVAPMSEKSERSVSRPRGSSSPFRCISNLVHQMNVEKDQELSIARFRIEELEALSACKQKEVCVLNSRLAATENMTHDVIRDLLGLKLDLTNYATLLDQHQLQKLMEVAEQQSADSTKKEEEILNLRKQMHDMINERDNCAMEINRRESEILATQLTVEQLKQRDQYLTIQNELLKVDKTRLIHRLTEMEKIVDELENQTAHRHLQRPTRDTHFRRGDTSSSSLTRRLLQSEQVLSQVNNELAKYRRHNNGNDQHKR